MWLIKKALVIKEEYSTIGICSSESYGSQGILFETSHTTRRSYCDADSRPASAASGVMRPQQPVTIKRRVSRVESLRNLLFNRGGTQTGHLDAKKLLMKKRARSAEKDKTTEKVRPRSWVRIPSWLLKNKPKPSPSYH